MEAEAGMGERLNGGTTPDPAAARSGFTGHIDTAALEEYVAVALRRVEPGSDGERRALAAFRAARGGRARHARTRRRDDWRPHRARAGRPLRTTLAVLLSGLTLGGVAYAAVGGPDDSTEDTSGRAAAPSTDSPSDSTPPTTPPSTEATPDRPGTPSAGAGPADRPLRADDTAEARCRAYAQVEARGEALEATAWARLVQAAGGEQHVDSYCADHTRTTKPPAPSVHPTPLDLPTVAVPPTPLDPPVETGRPADAVPLDPAGGGKR
ncbi:hypothetical protein ACIQ6Y_29635 [Streptomyces sp. NPDC096205]|uniref:hypothetical protein n=1 Tax=Streptomyces sp. NPDC096205 TaxID=3366081 RepID=UPI003804CA68